MILDQGIGMDRLLCAGCGKIHENVSIGEEMIVCGCGALIAFRENEKEIEYFCVSRETCEKKQEEAIHSDKRNLC